MLTIRLTGNAKPLTNDMHKYERWNAAYHLLPCLLEPQSVLRRNALRLVQASRIVRQLRTIRKNTQKRGEPLPDFVEHMLRANEKISERLDPLHHLNRVDKISTLRRNQKPRWKQFFVVSFTLRCFLKLLNEPSTMAPNPSIAAAQRVARTAMLKIVEAYKETLQIPLGERSFPDECDDDPRQLCPNAQPALKYFEEQWRSLSPVAHILLAIEHHARVLNPFDFRAIGKSIPQIVCTASAIRERLNSDAVSELMRDRHFEDMFVLPEVNVDQDEPLLNAEFSDQERTDWVVASRENEATRGRAGA